MFKLVLTTKSFKVSKKVKNGIKCSIVSPLRIVIQI
jgi:hypothetical protein